MNYSLNLYISVLNKTVNTILVVADDDTTGSEVHHKNGTTK